MSILLKQDQDQYTPDVVQKEPSTFARSPKRRSLIGMLMSGSIIIAAGASLSIVAAYQFGPWALQKQPDTPPESTLTAISLTNETISLSSPEPMAVPSAYAQNCAKCHGSSGEGTKKGPELTDVMTREDDQLGDGDLVEIINDAKSRGLSAKMPAFADKLGEQEKVEIVRWIRSIDQAELGDQAPRTQTASTGFKRSNKE